MGIETEPIDGRPTRIRAIRAATLSAVVAAAILRVWYCLLLPANTGDTLRHLVYGQLALQRGLGVASLPLAKISADFARVSWPDVSFNYPILALLFDVAMAWIWPSLFAIKLVLTLIEGANALLIWRWLGQKWIAVLYWISPISIWWASREGQFEPLQNLFCILAIGLFIRRRTLAWLLLALAIQVKLFAVFLLPLFIIGSRRRGDLAKGVGVFALGLLPTLLASLYYDAAGSFSRSLNMYFNPYYFNFLNRDVFLWVPARVIFYNQIVSDAAVVALIVLAWRSGRWTSYAAALGFMAAIKLATNVQPWYLMTMPAWLLTIDDRRVRIWMFLLLPLLDVYSLAQIVTGPRGYLAPPAYYAGITSVTRISVTHFP